MTNKFSLLLYYMAVVLFDGRYDTMEREKPSPRFTTWWVVEARVPGALAPEVYGPPEPKGPNGPAAPKGVA